MVIQESIENIESSVQARAQVLFAEHRQRIFKHTDHLFVGLMIFQWVAGIIIALVVSPQTWIGSMSQTHIHVWVAIFLGGAIAVVPVALGIFMPGEVITRYVIAVAQMLFSALLIHLTGGRIETHFHVFGSLAFLAFYRDWKVLIPATIVVAMDHMLRGIFWPQSVFGVLAASPWRWVEHTAWVVFEDIFLIASCKRSVKEMWAISERTAQLEANNQLVEVKVNERTQELVKIQNELKQASRLADIGTKNLEQSNRELETLLYIVSHDLKEPLRSIEYFSTSVKDEYLANLDEKGKDHFGRVIMAASRMRLLLDDILMTSRARRMKLPDEIVNGKNLISEALSRLEGKIKQVNAKINIAKEFPMYKVERVWATQAVLNLIANALKFTNEGEAPDIEICPYRENGHVGIMVADRGPGVPPEYDKKIFELFQRAVDRKVEGTGAGLAIVLEVARRHNGDAWVQPREGGGSEFIITFAKD
jgi:two-component system sensor histidine kinase/response regulator